MYCWKKKSSKNSPQVCKVSKPIDAFLANSRFWKIVTYECHAHGAICKVSDKKVGLSVEIRLDGIKCLSPGWLTQEETLAIFDKALHIVREKDRQAKRGELLEQEVQRAEWAEKYRHFQREALYGE